MSLSPRAIALQGIGSAPRFVALQGLVPVPQVFRRGGPGAPQKSRATKRRLRRDEEILLTLL